jgi:hypothetical protein
MHTMTNTKTAQGPTPAQRERMAENTREIIAHRWHIAASNPGVVLSRNRYDLLAEICRSDNPAFARAIVRDHNHAARLAEALRKAQTVAQAMPHDTVCPAHVGQQCDCDRQRLFDILLPALSAYEAEQ